MIWIKKYRRVWRIAIILLLLVAFVGPWGFDQINVPAKYYCAPPFVRLEGDFCGSPLSGIWMFGWMFTCIIGGAINIVTGFFTNKMALAPIGFEFLISLLNGLLTFLLILPIINTMRLFTRGVHPRRQLFTIISWILAIGTGLLWGLSGYLNFYWITWGIWLYIGLAVSALILEILLIFSNRKDPEGLVDTESVIS